MSQSLSKQLQEVREKSIQYREERIKLMAVENPTEEQIARKEELRVLVNKQRKEERFLSNRITQLRK